MEIVTPKRVTELIIIHPPRAIATNQGIKPFWNPVFNEKTFNRSSPDQNYLSLAQIVTVFLNRIPGKSGSLVKFRYDCPVHPPHKQIESAGSTINLFPTSGTKGNQPAGNDQRNGVTLMKALLLSQGCFITSFSRISSSPLPKKLDKLT